MAGPKDKLGRKKEAAIEALLTQRTIEEAARSAGVSTRTLYRWIKEPDFAAAYREVRRTAFLQSSARLQQMSGPAVTTLAKIMVDPTSPVATRVRAADSLLDRAAKAMELEDFEARLTELENAVEQTKRR